MPRVVTWVMSLVAGMGLVSGGGGIALADAGTVPDVADVTVTWIEPTTWVWDSAISNASFTEGWRVRSRARLTPDIDWTAVSGGAQVYVSGTTATGRRSAAFLSLGQWRTDGTCGKDPDGVWTYATAFPRFGQAVTLPGTYTVDQVCVAQGSTESCRPARPSEVITYVIPEAPLSPTEAYVARVYRDLFGRAPDAAGLAFWAAALAAGAPYDGVANSITRSDEYRIGLISAAYDHYLGRVPDSAGLAFWLGQMRAGVQVEQIQAGFIASDEYVARGGGTPAGWAALLYRTVLDRAPAPAETDGWVAALARGTTRADVALGFVYSTEHLSTVVDGYYLDLLGRHLDESGRAYWVAAIQHGARDEQIIAGIVSSAEYRGAA